MYLIVRTIISIRSKNKLELLIANWSHSYDLKRVFATYQRMIANRTSWSGTRINVVNYGITVLEDTRSNTSGIWQVGLTRNPYHPAIQPQPASLDALEAGTNPELAQW